MPNLSKKLFNSLKFTLLSIFLTLGVLSASAQGGAGDDPDFPDIPLDGGLSILLAAGAAYGGKKLYDKNKKN